MIKTLPQYWAELEQHLPSELLPIVRKGFIAGIGATLDFHRAIDSASLSTVAEVAVLQEFALDWDVMVNKAMLEDLGPEVCAKCENSDRCDHVGHPEIDVMPEGQARGRH